MSFKRHFPLIALSAATALLGAMPASSHAQLGPPRGASYGGSVPDSKTIVPGIAWYGVLQDAFDEAKRTGKPILFITAAAQCNSVPGMW